MSVTDPVFEEHTFAPEELSRIGAVVSAFEVEYALAATVRRWMPAYLAEAAKQRGLSDALPSLRAIVTSTDSDRFSEEQLPALIVSCLRTEERPDVRATGMYSARWRVDCQVVCSARGNRQARRLAQIYAATIRALLIQRAAQEETGVQMLSGPDWRGESYRSRRAQDERTIAEATVELLVHVAAVTWRFGGPLGIAETVDVEVTKKEEDC